MALIQEILNMTPQQQRNKTIKARNDREKLHKNCQVEIKSIGPHWGIYCGNIRCQKTGKWISWVKQDQLRAILQKETSK